MSRMSKYLRQRCSYEKMKLDKDGKVLLDKFGEPQYEGPKVIKCRRETTIKDVQTDTGSIMKSSTCYFTDASQSIRAGDKLDGVPVKEVLQYVNPSGVAEGYESYV